MRIIKFSLFFLERATAILHNNPYEIDDIIGGKLKNILESQFFTNFKIDLSKPCLYNEIRVKCKNENCRLPSILDEEKDNKKESDNYIFKDINENGQCEATENVGDNFTLVDLKKAKQDYTGYKNGSYEIWNLIYEIAKNDKNLKNMISGIHFSILIQMVMYYHTETRPEYVINEELYKSKYCSEYQKNLETLFDIIKKSFRTFDIDDFKCFDIDDKIRLKINELLIILKSTNDDTENTKLDYKNEVFEEIDNITNCIECGTCKLWGKIQFNGVNTIYKIFDNNKQEKIKSRDIFYLTHLFYKVYESLKFAREFKDNSRENNIDDESDPKSLEMDMYDRNNLFIINHKHN